MCRVVALLIQTNCFRVVLVVVTVLEETPSNLVPSFSLLPDG